MAARYPYAPNMASAADSARLAVLIDGDNTTPAIIEALLAEIAKYGSATVKRAYGDWTTPSLRGWKEAINAHAIQPMQQFAYTTGKNATDSALIIDAMDLLYTGNLDGFCLVSSDSDFTKLASRLRESGKTVYGFGEPRTPQPLVAACDKFVYLDVLRRPEKPKRSGGPRTSRRRRVAAPMSCGGTRNWSSFCGRGSTPVRTTTVGPTWAGSARTSRSRRPTSTLATGVTPSWST